MERYKMKDFSVGDSVYHLSNSKLHMVVVKLMPEMNEILCRWVDAKGTKQTSEFMPEELGMTNDLGPKVSWISL